MIALTLALVVAAVTVGSLHTLAPDHWVPFAALAKSERWSTARTAWITAGCGLGHVTVSVALGLAAAIVGLQLVERFGRRLESVAGLLLIGFGVVYGLFGLHRSVSSQWHEHGRAHVHWHGRGREPHGHDHPRRVTPWALFVLFAADPCVAVIPLMFAAAPLGMVPTVFVVIAYELATISTMIALVLPARAAVQVVRADWADRYGDVIAGALIVAIGIAVARFGL